MRYIVTLSALLLTTGCQSVMEGVRSAADAAGMNVPGVSSVCTISEYRRCGNSGSFEVSTEANANNLTMVRRGKTFQQSTGEVRDNPGVVFFFKIDSAGGLVANSRDGLHDRAHAKDAGTYYFKAGLTDYQQTDFAAANVTITPGVTNIIDIYY